MKNHLLISLKLTLATLILFGLLYPLTITLISKLSPGGGEGNFELIGQSFKSDNYFNGRPSAVNYNAAATGGSNKGPSNPEYLATVEERIVEFLKHNPGVERKDIPVDLVTASGGGLDPHISVEAAIIQIPRIAKARGLSVELLQDLVKQNTDRPLLGLFGPAKVNVLKVNLALEKQSNK